MDRRGWSLVALQETHKNFLNPHFGLTRQTSDSTLPSRLSPALSAKRHH